jgi:carbamoyltransferase
VLILGISCFYHDSSACVVRDGQIIAAAQEERFSRVKNTSEFPIQSINFCMQQAGVTLQDVDAVAYFEKPFLKFARVVADHVSAWPFSWPGFHRSMPKWLSHRLALPTLIEEELTFKGPIYFLKHHLSHAASAFYPSPFESAAILTADGVGEWATLSVGKGEGRRILIDREIHYPHSLGLLYTAVTTFLGFDAHGGEGKTMGLAGYGDPKSYRDKLKEVARLHTDGSFELDQSYFAFRYGQRMWSAKWEKLFGRPRATGEPWEQRHYDLAAACQEFIENCFILNARLLQKSTGLKNLCLAGGVTLNCVANAKILDQTDFQDVFVQPAAGDAGGSVGSALWVQHQLQPNCERQVMRHAYLGPEFSKREIERAFKAAKLSYREMDEAALCKYVARAIHDNKAIGWFQGRMEFGPRALGNRSIIGNPTFAGMKDILNLRIKKREAFRPFAPIVLQENANEYFNLNVASPYMLLAPQVRPEAQGRVPAITHVDGTARVQTCDKTSNPKLRRLIEEFHSLSGVPVIINTSFNRKGEPVVCQPEHAIDCFKHTQMDLLAIGDFVVEKSPGPSA